ncbi:MAG: tetratricopeptide repeat protein, partial [bacterium]|nr:tetratricopeptide repeat protein [bacterium]
MADNISALQEQAEACRAKLDLDNAKGCYDNILEIDPENAKACREIAKICSLRGKLQEAIEKYVELLEIYEKAKDFKNALDVADLLKRIDPQNCVCRVHAIQIYKEMHDTSAAVKGYLELAGLYAELGEGDESVSLLKKAKEIDPSDLDITVAIAEFYMNQGQMSESANHFRAAAYAFLQKRDFEKAHQLFSRVKLLVPNDIELLLILGNLNYMLGRIDEAAIDFRKAFTLDLTNVDALMAYGCVQQIKGQYRDAKLAFTKILAVNTSDITVIEKLGEVEQLTDNEESRAEAIKNYLLAASAYEQMDDKDHAIRLYRRVLKLS